MAVTAGIGEVVGGHVDRLDGGHRDAGDGGDALLQRGDLARQRRLVADPRGHAAEQTGHLAARLDEAVNVVHEEQDVLVLHVAEILRDGEGGEADAPAGARRLVHLAVDEHGAVEHAGGAHLGQHLVALARALADAGEDRDALVAFDDGADQFHDQYRLADAGAAEHGGLAALRQRRQQVDDLDAGLEQFGRRALLGQARGGVVDGRAGHVVAEGRAAVAGLAGNGEQPAEDLVADRYGDGAAGRPGGHAAAQPGSGLEGNGADMTLVEVALHLDHQRFRPVPFDDERLVDFRQVSGVKGHFDDGAMDGDDDAVGAVAGSGRFGGVVRFDVHRVILARDDGRLLRQIKP